MTVSTLMDRNGSKKEGSFWHCSLRRHVIGHHTLLMLVPRIWAVTGGCLVWGNNLQQAPRVYNMRCTFYVVSLIMRWRANILVVGKQFLPPGSPEDPRQTWGSRKFIRDSFTYPRDQLKSTSIQNIRKISCHRQPTSLEHLSASAMFQDMLVAALLILILSYVGFLMTISLVFQGTSIVTRSHGCREKVNEIVDACNRIVTSVQGMPTVRSADRDLLKEY